MTITTSITQEADTSSNSNKNKLQSLIYENATNAPENKPSLQVLDQLLLPSITKYIPVTDIQTTHRVIKDMNVRGAPLIAIVAILGLVVDLHSNTSQNELDAIVQMHSQSDGVGNALISYIVGKLEYIGTSRPTAVNMFNAITEIKTKLKDVVIKSAANGTTVDKQVLLSTLSDYADFMLQRDVNDNKLIGMNGAKQILSVTNKNKIRIMTICNTGSLATAGYGTALGVVRALIELDSLEQIIALETRPYNQGSRLTSYEMVVEQMPNCTLICDSMAASAIQNFNIDAIVVGADRICANGDTANKIGTYQLSVLAKSFNVPFYVAAPFTTLDISLQGGTDITIEVRPASELLQTSNAPIDVNVWNPAFDITPAKYITGGIITEKGIILPTIDGKLNVTEFVQHHTNVRQGDDDDDDDVDTIVITEKKESTLFVPEGYVEHNVKSLPKFVFESIPGAAELLQVTTPDDINCVEMGDGNLNLVFIVSSVKTDKKIIIKQALPYVRCVGESWPMTIDRSYYEYEALTIHKKACGEHVPDLYYFSRSSAIIAMQYLQPPIQILRKGLLQGIKYTTMAVNMGTFCAKTLFQTSGFALGTTEIRKQVEFWTTNSEMCSLTESVIFTEPYITHSNNNWTSPQLDSDKLAIENDVQLKLCANQYKIKFVTLTQALIHGDLHTGSVMCGPNPDETYVIDPEFAFYGPMGFDVGSFIANMLFSYVAQPGHIDKRPIDYDEWILQQIEIFWNTFVTVFTESWYNADHHVGFVFGRDKFSYNSDGIVTSLDITKDTNATMIDTIFFTGLLHDTIGFGGMEIIRRIVGIAHVEDLNSITDIDIKTKCEKHGLAIGKMLVKQSTSFTSIQQVIQAVRDTKI